MTMQSNFVLRLCLRDISSNSRARPPGGRQAA